MWKGIDRSQIPPFELLSVDKLLLYDWFLPRQAELQSLENIFITVADLEFSGAGANPRQGR